MNYQLPKKVTDSVSDEDNGKRAKEILGHMFELSTVTEKELRRMRSKQRQKETDKEKPKV